MNFSFQRHVRCAGSVAAIAGVLLENWLIVLVGWMIVAAGCIASLAKMEIYIEEQSMPKKEDEDAIR